MDAQALAVDLQARGFAPFSELGAVAAHVSAAYARRGDINDLVLVVDTTDPEAGPADPAAPHRASRRIAPFSAPFEDVVRLVKGLPVSFFAPLARITVIEIAEAPPSPEDRERLGAYVTPKRGPLLVGAMHVDAENKRVYANDGLSQKRTHLRKSDEPVDWVCSVFGAQLDPASGGASLDVVPLFGPRAVGAAAFFCSPLAGAALVAWNLHRTRRTGLGLGLFAVTTLVFAAVLGISEVYQEKGLPLLTPGLAIAGVIGFSKLSRSLFGDPLRKASAMLAVLLSVASVGVFCVVVAVPTVGVAMLTERDVVTANGSKVIFDRQTTVENATRLGTLLQERGVLVGPSSGVSLRTDGAQHSIILQFDDPHAHEPADVQAFYLGVAKDVSSQIFNGEVVSVVFQSTFGNELARVSSR